MQRRGAGRLMYRRLILEEPAVPPVEPVSLDLLHSLTVYPEIHYRLHSLLALYTNLPLHRRGGRLDELERLTLEVAAVMAQELLVAGWRPG